MVLECYIWECLRLYLNRCKSTHHGCSYKGVLSVFPNLVAHSSCNHVGSFCNIFQLSSFLIIISAYFVLLISLCHVFQCNVHVTICVIRPIRSRFILSIKTFSIQFKFLGTAATWAVFHSEGMDLLFKDIWKSFERTGASSGAQFLSTIAEMARI